ncbi:molybdopterin-binding protein (plasmid) [Methylobacterium oryzae CBMB20]
MTHRSGDDPNRLRGPAAAPGRATPALWRRRARRALPLGARGRPGPDLRRGGRRARGLPDRLSALRDGFAVEAASVGGASPYAPVTLVPPPPWIEAGDSLPPGTDAVLLPEALEGGAVVADVAVREGVRAPGEEIGAGEILVAAGGRIGALQRLGLAAAGLDSVSVRLPRLRILSTRAPVLEPLAGLIARLVEEHGGRAEITAAGGEPEAVAEAIAESVQDGLSDAILVIGGSGLGRTDHSAEALGRAGTLRAHGIALRPGETAAIGAVRGARRWSCPAVPRRPSPSSWRSAGRSWRG